MATAHMLTRITRNNLIQAALRLKIISGWNAETARAIDSGFAAVEHGRFVFDGHTLRVESCNSDAIYTVTEHACTCEGFGFRGTCKHLRGRALLIIAMLTGKPEAFWQREIARCTPLPVLESTLERAVRISPAEAAIERWEAMAVDADIQALADELTP